MYISETLKRIGMETIKSYTDLEQSKKLAEFLPLESADGFWEYHDRWRSEGDDWEGYEDYPRAEPYLEYTRKENEWKEEKQDIPCWSLAALLKTLNFPSLTQNKEDEWEVCVFDHDNDDYIERTASNPIDACYQMIIHLNELNLL